MQRRVNTVLIASGGGTDANAIIEAYLNCCIPNICIKALISTKENAGCLNKASHYGIKSVTLDRKKLGQEKFNSLLAEHLRGMDCQLVFLVGCIVKIEAMAGIAIYNIHPADPHNFGGIGMYGLKVHEKVIADVEDKIKRGKCKSDDRFFTYPTIHEAEDDYDSGAPLLRISVEIPSRMIASRLANEISLSEAAETLQKIVLPYEWLMLPPAVKMAAKKIEDSPKNKVRTVFVL
jgi:phosphoribosylglycinamide formyltransferase-1